MRKLMIALVSLALLLPTVALAKNKPSHPGSKGKAPKVMYVLRGTLTAYTASLYSARVPKDWTQEEDDVQKTGYFESKWRDPANPQSSMRRWPPAPSARTSSAGAPCAAIS